MELNVGIPISDKTQICNHIKKIGFVSGLNLAGLMSFG